MKKCTKCKKEKEETEFSKNKNFADGLNYWCKVCAYECSKKTFKRNQESNLTSYIPPLAKVCSKCKIEKSSDNFGKNTTTKDGLYTWCKECLNAGRRQQTVDNGVSKSAKLCKENGAIKLKSNNTSWVNNLIRDGKLDEPTEFVCAMDDCTNQAIHYHHLKYDSRSIEDPISIITPLCRECHDLFHIRQNEGIDLTDKILTQIELEYIRYKSPHIRFIKEKI